MYSGAAARAAELRKYTQNDTKCAELSWKCIPLVVECYGFLTSSHSFSHSWEYLYKSMALADLLDHLSHSIVRANARAILSRSYSHLVQQVDELCV